MNAHEMLCCALSNAAPKNDPHEIVCAALEFAKHEADALYTVLTPDREAVLAAALEGRLKALYAFIGEHCEIRWRDGHEPEVGE